ncbi:hypothetical protein RFI_10817, partial [Reticulomyxa filosa]
FLLSAVFETRSADPKEKIKHKLFYFETTSFQDCRNLSYFLALIMASMNQHTNVSGYPERMGAVQSSGMLQGLIQAKQIVESQTWNTLKRPRVVFISLPHLFWSYQGIPMDVLCTSLFIFRCKENWLFGRNPVTRHASIHFRPRKSGFENLIEKMRLDENFMELLQYKSKHKEVLWLEPSANENKEEASVLADELSCNSITPTNTGSTLSPMRSSLSRAQTTSNEFGMKDKESYWTPSSSRTGATLHETITSNNCNNQMMGVLSLAYNGGVDMSIKRHVPPCRRRRKRQMRQSERKFDNKNSTLSALDNAMKALFCSVHSSDPRTETWTNTNTNMNMTMTKDNEQWERVSDFVCAFKDSVTDEYYNRLTVDETWWKWKIESNSSKAIRRRTGKTMVTETRRPFVQKLRMRTGNPFVPELVKTQIVNVEAMLNLMEHCNDLSTIASELRNFNGHFHAFAEVLHQSNPTLIPMAIFDTKKFWVKCMLLNACFHNLYYDGIDYQTQVISPMYDLYELPIAVLCDKNNTSMCGDEFDKDCTGFVFVRALFRVFLFVIFPFDLILFCFVLFCFILFCFALLCFVYFRSLYCLNLSPFVLRTHVITYYFQWYFFLACIVIFIYLIAIIYLIEHEYFLVIPTNVSTRQKHFSKSLFKKKYMLDIHAFIFSYFAHSFSVFFTLIFVKSLYGVAVDKDDLQALIAELDNRDEKIFGAWLLSRQRTAGSYSEWHIKIHIGTAIATFFFNYAAQKASVSYRIENLVCVMHCFDIHCKKKLDKEQQRFKIIASLAPEFTKEATNIITNWKDKEVVPSVSVSLEMLRPYWIYNFLQLSSDSENDTIEKYMKLLPIQKNLIDIGVFLKQWFAPQNHQVYTDIYCNSQSFAFSLFKFLAPEFSPYKEEVAKAKKNLESPYDKANAKRRVEEISEDETDQSSSDDDTASEFSQTSKKEEQVAIQQITTSSEIQIVKKIDENINKSESDSKSYSSSRSETESESTSECESDSRRKVRKTKRNRKRGKNKKKLKKEEKRRITKKQKEEKDKRRRREKKEKREKERKNKEKKSKEKKVKVAKSTSGEII